MTAPNRNTLWARVITDEFSKAGVDAVCIAPGSRSTPLTVAFDRHPEIRVFSHLDERAAAFFALGRAKRTGRPTPLICTSGTAAANFHPAVIEASQSRVPLVVMTADRPPELRDSGANQTIDQEKLYGSAVRWYRDLPEPAVEDRKLRSLRTDCARAVTTATGPHPGPVHLNVPFRKPLDPVEVPDDVPEGFAAEFPLAAEGRTGPFVSVQQGTPHADESTLSELADALDTAARPLVVVGPDDHGPAPRAIANLTDATGAPVLADPLSRVRFGPHVAERPICGGYDSYLAAEWPAPDVVLRFGASPTSKVLRTYLEESGATQFVVDPAGEWREATFTATALVVADPTPFAAALADRCSRSADDWTARFEAAETRYWELVGSAHDEQFFEGTVLGDVVELAPDPTTLFVSNSMPVRDLDRFGQPREAAITALANRGASGIDGVTSSALGAGSATDDPLVLVTGDLAYYHDMNGLLALSRCGVDATIVLVNNDGGGIFHMLPIEEFDPPFTRQFKTPHGLDFEATSDLYDLDFVRAADRTAFREAFAASVGESGTRVIEVQTDAATSHRFRERLHGRVCDTVGRPE
ncbi:2-succinyl-5-enolpyruvyl-6-hydroxy-3-cyclohexene-1-carboxylic-acid synthase [Haladaptatus sp. DYSN1]|uniref:2-succinyl-5-enolpyruvyl-6-hydroxy-3- cyclohexene-1-carboxylic-acid synthase n=1 Tax=unclassified Haladaptatus TaxID=2622732 RepID=UPI0024059271|nr:2-succinyl-5-enolpyruvyl-6-hydroxy-3-cyclohexene-1-carboxylic-acid synthase [Haladaptatus sp. DYSN1]